MFVMILASPPWHPLHPSRHNYESIVCKIYSLSHTSTVIRKRKHTTNNKVWTVGVTDSRPYMCSGAEESWNVWSYKVYRKSWWVYTVHVFIAGYSCNYICVTYDLPWWHWSHAPMLFWIPIQVNLCEVSVVLSDTKFSEIKPNIVYIDRLYANSCPGKAAV